jgi:hypothetical protein
MIRRPDLPRSARYKSRSSGAWLYRRLQKSVAGLSDVTGTTTETLYTPQSARDEPLPILISGVQFSRRGLSRHRQTCTVTGCSPMVVATAGVCT